jgi:aconitase A
VLYEQYSRWHDDHGGSDRKLSLTAWGKMMSKNKYVRKSVERNYTYYTIQNPDVVDLQDWEDVYQDLAKVLGVESPQVLTTTNTDLEIEVKNLPNATQLEKIRAKILQDQQNDDFFDDIC